MAIFSPDKLGIPDRAANSALSVGSDGTPLAQGQKNEQIIRQGASAQFADFDIINHDLSESEWDVVESTDLSRPPDVGGTSRIVALIASESDEQFELEITPQVEISGEYTDLTAITKDMDSRLESNSATDQPHFIYEDISVPSDTFKIEVMNTGTPAENIINGTINMH